MKKGWDEIEERFRSKVWVEADDCWLWMAARDDHGYGYYWDTKRKRMIIAPRFAYEHAVGPIPEGMYVLHRCNNPPCVRIDHLYIGDQADNMRDCRENGGYGVGEDAKNVKLTEDQVRVIRLLYKPRKVSYRYLGELFGVSAGAVQGIIERRSWRHVE